MPELKISEAVDMIGDVYSKILFGYNEDAATTLVGYDGVGESGIDNPEVDQLLCIALNHLEIAEHTLKLARIKEKDDA